MSATLVPLHEVERQLARQFRLLQGQDEKPINRARLSNLIVFCDCPSAADSIADDLREITAVHPARVLLLVGQTAGSSDEVSAETHVQAHLGEKDRLIFSELVTLRAEGVSALDRLPYAVRGLLIGDLPTDLWWAAHTPPALAGPLLYELAENVQQVIYDSIGWPDPARGVAATGAWLGRFERGSSDSPGRWRVASDLNWRRLKSWRRTLSQALAPETAPRALTSIREVLVEHGPHASVQAWELVSWLAAKLGWRVQTSRVQPGVEILWRLQASHGLVSVRLRRLAAGPSEIRRVNVQWEGEFGPVSLDMVVESETHLAIIPEGVDVARRTIAYRPTRLAELVGRQLSDRDRDPIFRESMTVAQSLAQSLLG